MRNVLTNSEEDIERTRVWIGITYPVVIVFFVSAIFIAIRLEREYSWTIFIPPVIHFVLACTWAPLVWRFLHRLKGEKREEFLRLYRHLHECSRVDDIIDIAITIDDMAALVEGEYSVVRDFVFQRAGKFLIGATHVPLRIPGIELLVGTLRVLRSGLEELPEYLSSEDYLIREAASRRLAELQSAAQ